MTASLLLWYPRYLMLDSHDQSLKLLLSQDPTGFLRFGLGPDVQVLGAIETDLPGRGRIVDGCYQIEREGAREVAHLEFFRMHQAKEELALDVGEAQLRLYRRERLPVRSLVWDLYGSPRAKVLQRRQLSLGRAGERGASRVCYVRVNLRGMSAAELLDRGPGVLYPLVVLTRDGAQAEPLGRAVAAIERRPELSSPQRADHMAVLRFLAEAEKVPLAVLESYLPKEKLMESTLYRQIFQDGEARGEVRGEARALIRYLVARLGRIPVQVSELIMAQAKDHPEHIDQWLNEAYHATEPQAAEALLRKIAAV